MIYRLESTKTCVIEEENDEKQGDWKADIGINILNERIVVSVTGVTELEALHKVNEVIESSVEQLTIDHVVTYVTEPPLKR